MYCYHKYKSNSLFMTRLLFMTGEESVWIFWWEVEVRNYVDRSLANRNSTQRYGYSDQLRGLETGNL